jgi:endonuclease/exonuclease/phosphatase (EEP) superfamily protein YafD
VQFRGINFANVHLSHGQFLNRWQLLHIASALEGPSAIIGDFNAVGPTMLPGFRDIGPRRRTHRASNIVNLRLDRCLAREIRLTGAQVLERGASDHHPIVLDLAMTADRHAGGALLAL